MKATKKVTATQLTISIQVKVEGTDAFEELIRYEAETVVPSSVQVPVVLLQSQLEKDFVELATGSPPNSKTKITQAKLDGSMPKPKKPRVSKKPKKQDPEPDGSNGNSDPNMN